MAYEQPISLKNHQNLCSHDTKNKPDEIKTEIENLLYDEVCIYTHQYDL